MSSLTPRPPYTEDELIILYPDNLQLQLVQVILRHGERTPVSSRFSNAGLAAYWPYCNAARRMRSAMMEDPTGASWDVLAWRRQLETFAADDGPIPTKGSNDEVASMCNLGELTDQGRASTLLLGQRLRHLYVKQLHFMPEILQDVDSMYLRATPIPRALESLQQAFWGMYPRANRTSTFPPPTIITRTPADETLYPNEVNCRRFRQLSRAFAQKTADRWNDTTDMDYLTKLIGKWLPEDSPRVKVDGHPRLTGIMDTVNATLAHPQPTRLPAEFYNARGRAIIDKISVEEWYSGYKESQEYRSVGIGSLMGDVVERMVISAECSGADGIVEAGDGGRGRDGEKRLRFGISGAHDTTIAGALTALGAFEGEDWPPFTSHVAFELFRQEDTHTTIGGTQSIGLRSGIPVKQEPRPQGIMAWLFGRLQSQSNQDRPIIRRRLDELSEVEKSRLDGHFVRIRYNDKVMQVPSCAQPGNHLPGDKSFCTLEAFKRVVDKFTPENWRKACGSNLDKTAFPIKPEPAGW